MIVIFEGVDGSGKSELAKWLAEEEPMFHLYTRDKTPLDGGLTVERTQGENYGSMMMALQTGADVIFDRSFVSEWVYGHVMRGENSYDSVTVAELDAAVSKVPHMAVLMNFFDLVDTWERPVEHDPDVIARLQDRYMLYVSNSQMNWHILDAGASRETVREVLERRLNVPA